MTSLDEPAPLPMGAVATTRAGTVAAGVTRILRSTPWAVGLITAVAALLRFFEIDDVSANPFYDAAVRSMAMSWHNLLFGAFDPGAILSVDKPPIDLWLQVASVKLFGWSEASLKLPEAIGGTLAVPLLYDAVRRVVGRPAGLAAAMVLAVLPVSVLTSRSDTMDSLMMFLVVGALWLTVRGAISGHRRWLILAGMALGLAFNVKLLEALVAAPALFVLYGLAGPVPWRRRLSDLTLGGVGLVAVGLSWATVVSLAPGKHPYPIGSTDGTVWNVMFVFNGFGRVSSPPVPGKSGGPGLLRLVEPSAWHFDTLVGCVVVAALAIGGVAVLTALARRVRLGPDEPRPLPRAFAVALLVWIVTGAALFSHVAVLHARYLEAFTPALAAAIGYGAAYISGLCDWDDDRVLPSLTAVTLALAAICAYTFTLKPWSIAWGAVAVTVAAAGGALLARAEGRAARGAKWLTAGLVVACAVLFPVHQSLRVVRLKTSDSIGLATHRSVTERALWTYLEPRSAGTRYELIADEPLALAPLIIHDGRPILPLTSFRGLPVLSLSELKSAIQAGQVRYAVVGRHVCQPAGDHNAACVPTARWIRRNGIDVSSAAGVGGGQRLYLLLPF
jgi:4-amino-4-deoxy-L-arabinose transferase-like glycosyltransferase